MSCTSTSQQQQSSSSSSSSLPLHLIGSKLRARYESNFVEHVSAPTSSFAKEQLKKMGWKDGTGLGKRRDGIQSHIRIKKRLDGLGLGHDTNTNDNNTSGTAIITNMNEDGCLVKDPNGTSDEWWKDSVGSTLAKLSAKKKKKKEKKEKKAKKGEKKKETKKRKRTNDDDDEEGKTKRYRQYTDEELFQATGGARFGMRAGITQNLKKWNRTEGKNNSSKNSDDDKKEKRVGTESAIKEEGFNNNKEEKKKDKKKEKKQRKEKKKEKKSKSPKKEKKKKEKRIENS